MRSGELIRDSNKMGWQEFQVVALPGMQVVEFDEMPRKARNKLLRVSKEVREEEERIIRMKRAWVEKQMKATEEAFYGTPHWGAWDSSLTPEVCLPPSVCGPIPGPHVWGCQNLI